MAEIVQNFTLKSTPKMFLSYQRTATKRARETPLFVVEKSRRTGMTWAFAAEAVMAAAAEVGASNVYYLSYNFDMTREFMDDCAEFARSCAKFGYSTGFVYEGNPERAFTRARISFPNGKAITALPSNARSLRGKQGIVIIDEAAFHADLPQVMKAAIALTMWGGRVAVISTHDGADNEFANLINTIRAGKQTGDVMRITLNEALCKGLYQRICRRANRPWTKAGEDAWQAELRSLYGDSAAEELDVVPARGAANWLSRSAIEGAMTDQYPVVRLVPPNDFTDLRLADRDTWMADWVAEEVEPLIAGFDPDRYSHFGQDFARTNDLSVIAAGQFDDDAILQCRFLIEMRNVPFREQKLLLAALCNTLPRFANGLMDARGNGQQLAEEIADEFGKDRISGIMATNNSYLAMFPRLKARIEDRTIAIPRSEGVINDLQLVKLVNGIPKVADRADDRADGAKGRRHGDAAIALMHLVAAADEAVVDIAFTSMGQRDSTKDTQFTNGLINTGAPW